MSGQIDISCVNKVKLEERKEFDTSIFLSVYKKSIKLTEKIIEDNKLLSEKLNTPYSDMEVNNVISFLGERGMGKSSAMLSFLHYLSDYKYIANDKYNLNLKDNYSVKFYVLPRIDVAMLIRGESIFDIILASMWSAFEKKVEYSNGIYGTEKETEKAFSRVKHSYELYKKSMNEKDKDEHLTSVRELKDLSRCINLVEDFKKLVELFLECMRQQEDNKNWYLVIPVDDLDVNTEDVYSVLEQIRLFMMIPKVIVLVTADMERLAVNCRYRFYNKLVPQHYEKEDLNPKILNYTNKYLGKIFPTNMRIYMPEINGYSGNEFMVRDMDKVLVKDKVRLKELYFALIYKALGLYFYPNVWGNHILLEESLRETVNDLYELIDITQDDIESLSKGVDWLFYKCDKYLHVLEDEGYIRHVYDFMNLDLDSANRWIYELINNIISSLPYQSKLNINSPYSKITYGSVLNAICELKGYTEVEGKDVTCISTLYSLQILRNTDVNAMEKLISKNIFDATIKGDIAVDVGNRHSDSHSRISMKTLNKQKPVFDLNGNVLYFDFNFPSKCNRTDIISFIEQNQEKLYGYFCLCFLLGMDVWSKGEHSHVLFKDSEEQESIKSEEKMGEARKIVMQAREAYICEETIDNLFLYATDYKTRLEGYLQNVFKGICEYLGKTFRYNKSDINKLKNFKKRTNQYEQWIKNYNIQSYLDILPIKSIDVMHRLATEVEKIRSTTNDRSAYISRTEKRINNIIDKLEDIDTYYQENVKGVERQYSSIIKELWDFFKANEVLELDDIIINIDSDITI